MRGHVRSNIRVPGRGIALADTYICKKSVALTCCDCLNLTVFQRRIMNTS